MSRNTIRKYLAAGSAGMAEAMVRVFRLGLMLYLFSYETYTIKV